MESGLLLGLGGMYSSNLIDVRSSTLVYGYPTLFSGSSRRGWPSPRLLRMSGA